MLTTRSFLGFSLVIAVLTLGARGAHAQSSGAELALSAIRALEASGSATSIVRQETGGLGEWTRLQVEYADEPVPLSIDLLYSNFVAPSKVVYLLPGGGLNFQSNFFTPIDHNLAHYLRERGYLVIGINAREDSLLTVGNSPLLKDWGLGKRKQDIRKVISTIQPVFPFGYELLGHSQGGWNALDYAATYSDSLERVMVIDSLGPYDPNTETDLIAKAADSYDAYLALIANGEYANTAMFSFKALIAAATATPQADSGFSRQPYGHPGNFTWEGFLYFALVHTGLLEGDTTPYTGRADAWWYHQGFFDGFYTFDPDPLQDRYGLAKTPIGVINQAVLSVGAGNSTNAARRDIVAVMSGNGAYSIDFRAIDEPVNWVNAELGFGDHPYGARLIHQGGNPRVRFTVVPGYGHGDPTYSSTAETDYWPLLVQ